jgi:hypothetical protein
MMLSIKNKPARITVKLLLYLLGAIILLFAAISIYVEINKKDILNSLRKGVSENLKGEVKYRDADISIWKNFPFIRVHFYDMSIRDSVYHMPFVQLKEVAGQVSVWQYFRKNIEVSNLYLEGGVLHVFTDTTGYTNKYLMELQKKEVPKEKKELRLNKVTLSDVRLILENRQRNKLFDFQFKRLVAAVDYEGDILDINLKNNAVVNSMAFNLAKGSYLKGQSVKMNADVRFDPKNATVSFNEEKILLDDQPYFVKGNFYLRDKGRFNLSVRTKNAPYSNIQGVVPQNISSKLKKFNLEKPIDLEAQIEGPLAYRTVPRVVATWKVKNNTLTTSAATFTNCSFTGTFNNEKVKGAGFTDQNSEIALKQLTGNWEGIILNGKSITVTNLVDPYLQLALASATDFKTLDGKLGLRTIDLLEGNASLNLLYAGPLPEDISILDRLTGQLNFSNGKIRYVPRGFTFNNCSGTVFFSDNNVKVDNLKCDLGSNHFVVNVSGTNMSGLSKTDAGKASILCDVYVPSLNIAELTGIFSKKKKVTVVKPNKQKLINTASRVDDIMDNGSLSVSLSSGTVHYKNFTGQNLKGNVVFANDDLLLNNVTISHANGSMNVNGSIRQDATTNTASAKVNLQNVDVKKLFHAFNNFGQDGIASENIQGTLNALTNIGLSFDANGSIIPGTIKGTVDFSLRNGALINYEPLQDIKNSVLKKRDMSHVTFAELKDKLEIDAYKVKINRMEIQSSAIGLFVDGTYDIKKTDTKINIQVPLKGLKQRDSTFVPKNIGIDSKAGTSVYLEGKVDKKTGKVKFGLNTSRTIRKLF